MTIRRVIALAGAAGAAVVMAPAFGGLAAVGLLWTGLAASIITVGLLIARCLEAVIEPTARPMGRRDRCRLCRSGRLVLGGIWVCPHCDFADPVEVGAPWRGESPAL